MNRQKNNYFVSRKNVLAWLACGLLVCAAVIRVVYFCAMHRAEISGTSMLFMVIFPLIANLWFAGSVIFSGPERLYRSAIPALLILLFCAICASSPSGWYYLLTWFVYIAAATAYFSTVSGKSGKRIRWWLVPLCLVLVILQIVSVRGNYAAAGTASDVLPSTSELFMMLSVLLVCCAMHKLPVEEGTYVKRWGDRPDGRLVRSLPPMSKVAPYIMVNRNGSSNLINDTVDITPIEEYVRQKRKQGLKDFGPMHAIIASYVRTVAEYPALNRFLSGQKVYSRDRTVEVIMAIKKEMSTDAPDTMISVYLDAGDTAEDVYYKFQKEIDAVKETSDLDSGFDNLAAAINLIPGLLLKFVVWLLKTLDYFGLLPAWLLKLSPFHGSMIITSMGSLGIPPIFHHLYDFGNLPVFIAFGAKYRENEIKLDGTIVPKKYMDFCYVTDERICDGFYYAAALKRLRHIMLRPEQLDERVEVKRDID